MNHPYPPRRALPTPADLARHNAGVSAAVAENRDRETRERRQEAAFARMKPSPTDTAAGG